MTTGTITGVNGNLISVAFEGAVALNEIGYALLGETRLMCEIVRIRGRVADMQVFEDTVGLSAGCKVEFTGGLLSIELGPGLLKQIFDGLQNPLPGLAEQYGFFLQRGKYMHALPRDAKWAFTPVAKPGDVVRAGDTLGTVPEGVFTHRIMVPFGLKGRYTVKDVAPAGDYTVEQDVATLVGEDGSETKAQMMQRWPVKVPISCFAERLRPEKTMVTQIRTIDTFFPVALGGTYCIPGPFGAGKTVLQQTTSRFAQVDIVIYAACGEMVEITVIMHQSMGGAIRREQQQHQTDRQLPGVPGGTDDLPYLILQGTRKSTRIIKLTKIRRPTKMNNIGNLRNFIKMIRNI